MMRHSRLPALIILVAVLGVGGFYLRHLSLATPASGVTLEQLESTIAGGKASAQTWSAYARRLGELGRYGDSALAWKKVLELEPNRRDARINCALALAQTSDEEELHSFMNELTFTDPKLTVEIFQRRELQGWLVKPRFVSMLKEAKSQAMD